MNKSKELLKWLFISIGVFCLSFVFLYMWNRIDERNYIDEDFYYLGEVSEKGQNAYIDLYGYNSELIYVMDAENGYSYYVYLDEMEQAILLKINETEAKDCEKQGYRQAISCYVEGGAYPLDKELKDEVFSNLKDSGYYSYVNSIGLSDIYLDSELVIYEDTETYEMLFLVTFCVGIIGIIVNLILVLKGNWNKLKENKSIIWKWLFRLSFFPIGIILMISILFGLNEGFDEFLLYLLIICLICTVIPILPIALIYQIVYLILYFKNKNKK